MRIHIAQGLANILGFGTISHLTEDAMGKNERGFSGAKVVRKRVFFSSGASTSMIFKLTDRKERCAMKLLTEQKQCSPACYSEDVQADMPCWMAMEDLGQQKFAEPCNEPWLQRVADSLASIHSMNMDKGAEMPWLPIADEAYWQSVVTTLSVDHFERRMEQDAAFNQEFGSYLPKLREIGQRFAASMSALSKENHVMTLTHGDLQMRDGAHIYCCGGTPRIIDFGFCRYAPFYLDLAGWFGREDLQLYYDALCERGFTLRYADFEERARTAYRYNGFIYLCPSVMDWKTSADPKGKRLLQALYIILHGDFPERKRAYSDELLAALLREHQIQSI